MFFDWIIGTAFRPGATFERSREELRFGYWWIILTVMMLESVVGIFRPQYGTGTEVWADAALFIAMFDLLMFDLQALLLLGAARYLRWQVTWTEATKFAGLLWSIICLEDLANFYPAMKGYAQAEIWISGAFGLWYLIVMAIGIRRLSGLNLGRTLLLTLLAGVTWRGGIFWLAYYSLHS